MTLEQLSNLSQTVAAVAVIVSLVFVGMQLRQSTEQSRQANRLARAQVTAEIRNALTTFCAEHFWTPTSRTPFSPWRITQPVEERHVAPLSGLCFNFMGVARQAYELQQSGLIDAWALRDVEQQLFTSSATRVFTLYIAQWLAPLIRQPSPRRIVGSVTSMLA